MKQKEHVYYHPILDKIYVALLGPKARRKFYAKFGYTLNELYLGVL